MSKRNYTRSGVSAEDSDNAFCWQNESGNCGLPWLLGQECCKNRSNANVQRKWKPEKDTELVAIIAWKQEKYFLTYGCRRIWPTLKQDGIVRNPKTILRIMRKYDLLSKIRCRRK